MLDQATQIREQVARVGADLVILPQRREPGSGRGIYAEDDLFLVKRLRREGINATYLDDVENRAFVSLNSAFGELANELAVGIVGAAAYDALRYLVARVTDRDAARISIEVTDASPDQPGQWTVSGKPSAVLDALEQLKARHILPDDPQDQDPGAPARATPIDPAVSQAPHDYSNDQSTLTGGRRPTRQSAPTSYTVTRIRELTNEADDLMAQAAAALVDGNGRTEAQSLALSALAAYRSALNWAEDTNLESEAHTRLDEAGRWKRQHLGCRLDYEDGAYYETCPVSLGHNRVGLSVGGVATRMCSICALDISECEHDPTEQYLVSGGPGIGSLCRVCAETDCRSHRSHLQYWASPISVVTEMRIDEVSLVARPAFKDARITRQSVDTASLRRSLGSQFALGMPVSCDQCLRPCGGLIQVEAQSPRGSAPDTSTTVQEVIRSPAKHCDAEAVGRFDQPADSGDSTHWL